MPTYFSCTMPRDRKSKSTTNFGTNEIQLNQLYHLEKHSSDNMTRHVEVYLIAEKDPADRLLRVAADCKGECSRFRRDFWP